ncbi:lipase, partial [Vibrio vulnificus]
SHSTPGQKVNTNISTKPTQQQTTNQNIKPKNTDEATIKSNQYKNKYPVVLVHGFLGLVGDNAPALYPNYWGGTKFPVKKRLEK